MKKADILKTLIGRNVRIMARDPDSAGCIDIVILPNAIEAITDVGDELFLVEKNSKGGSYYSIAHVRAIYNVET